MNTEVRKGVFNVLMSSEVSSRSIDPAGVLGADWRFGLHPQDYVDACERLLQLGLSDVQQREIARVLLQCSGNVSLSSPSFSRTIPSSPSFNRTQEKSYNPYYTLVAQRLCQKSHSFQITLQYLLWDFLRDLGEKSVGGEELVKNMQDDSANATHKVPERKVGNLAKLYSWCVAKEALNISILKVRSQLHCTLSLLELTVV